MEESTSREKILKKIRNALISKSEAPYPEIEYDSEIYELSDDPLEIQFAGALNSNDGKFIYCETTREFLENLSYLASMNQWEQVYAAENRVTELLDEAGIKYVSGNEKLRTEKVAITQCEFLVARLGGVIVSSNQISGRRSFVFPEVHIVLAFTSQMTSDLRDAMKNLKKKYEQKLPSLVTMITGPSRTADIEKTLVMGVHGPKELYVFLVEDLI
jgi:L-lactate dehydrogenase complex protein LldG